MRLHEPGFRIVGCRKFERERTLKIGGVGARRVLKTGKLKCGLLAVVFCLAGRGSAQVEYVDPTIGNVGILLEPTRPTVYLPNSMVRMYPSRADALDDQIKWFPLTINSHRMQELFSIMPGTGAPAAYDQETTAPYYYSTRFDDSLIRTEFTANRTVWLLSFCFS
jgi:hypothetical protein